MNILDSYFQVKFLFLPDLGIFFFLFLLGRILSTQKSGKWKVEFTFFFLFLKCRTLSPQKVESGFSFETFKFLKTMADLVLVLEEHVQEELDKVKGMS